jgi:hypothetical protein
MKYRNSAGEIGMKKEIGEDILKKTNRCEKEFSCLSGERNELCKVESSSGYQTLFVKCMSDEQCCYRTHHRQ